MPASKTARQRAREDITAEILAAARARLAEAGPGELSLRAVARDVGMVSSAVYRYYPSRNDLLTALLIAAYDELGEAAEAADDAVDDRDDHLGRWTAVCVATRAWSLTHPYDYALLYGSPVPGYAAPQDTVGPATRVIVRLVTIIVAAHQAGATSPVAPSITPAGVEDAVADAIEFVRVLGNPEYADLPEITTRTIMAWTTIFGTLSFELFGHLVGSVSDYDAYFAQVISRLAADLGLAA
jgi:AcrR family transcriptional regulator